VIVALKKSRMAQHLAVQAVVAKGD
jgi:hypothetical protein